MYIYLYIFSVVKPWIVSYTGGEKACPRKKPKKGTTVQYLIGGAMYISFNYTKVLIVFNLFITSNIKIMNP